MIASLETNDEVHQNSTEYYYISPQSHSYYCPVPFNDDSNNPHHYRPSIYETNHYYTLSNQQFHNNINEKDLDNQVSSTHYQSICNPHYTTDEHPNEILYASKLSNYHSATTYDYSIPSTNCIPPLDPICNQHPAYTQSTMKQANCNTNDSKDYSTSYSSSNGICQSDSVAVELLNRPLWLKFASHIHENVVTKTGRRMFPTLELKVSGLKSEAIYDIYVEMVLVDTNHWKFNSGKWMASDQADSCPKNSHRYLHPDSPSSGEQWMKNTRISFSKLKLTNNKKLAGSDSQNQMPLLLNSMHKYIPRLSIVQISEESIDSLSKYTFTFPETQFIAVTAYQNTDITQLKIDNNPFAKGFRDCPDNRYPYNSYTYASIPSTDGCGNNLGENNYENMFEHEHLQKKRRHY
ncbi:hypothetical protein I4U23_020477 [Adineta vaga]|nr:hypothetical protein I4U23_020477 [Adineta vaga]